MLSHFRTLYKSAAV